MASDKLMDLVNKRIEAWCGEMKQKIDGGEAPSIVAQEYLLAATEFIRRTKIYFGPPGGVKLTTVKSSQGIPN